MSRHAKSKEIRVHPDERIGPGRSRRRSFFARVFGRSNPESGGREPRGRGKPKRRRSVFGGFVYWCVVLGIWGGIGLVGVLAWHAAQLPPIDQLAVPKRPPNIAILDVDGVPVANRGDSGGPAIRLDDLPTYIPQAFVAIEDRRFYAHFGVDAVGIMRALARNLSGAGGMQGGSTITQQLAKNLFLTQERTISRKIQEAILALWLEHNYSKDRILELYLNRVYFGSGAYGIEAAAQRYFGRSARQITLQEAAMLAGLMVAPSRLAPNRNPRGAAERAALVVAAMSREGYVTDKMAALALAKPAEATRETGSGSINYAADYIMDALDETIGAIEEDIVVSTTLRTDIQSAAERALALELERRGARFGVSQGAVLSMDPGGQIRAMVGGRNYGESQFNRAVAAKRQPGSAFKPFVYLGAIERGLTPETVREDSPVNVNGWKPENSNREYQGPVTLQRALAFSLNTVAVRLGIEVGPRKVAETARRMGIQSPLTDNATIALGTSEVTLLELVSAYAPFANGGIRIQPHVITQVKTASGAILYRRKGASFGRVIEPQAVLMMNAMLQETLLTGTAARADARGFEAAGKTGTSQEYRDGWFIGYTSQLLTGVWLGNDDSSPTKRLSGANLPVAVWTQTMREAHRLNQPPPLPSNWKAQPAPQQTSQTSQTPERPGAITPTNIALGAPRVAPINSVPVQIGTGGGAGRTDARDLNSRDLLPPANLGETTSRERRESRGLLDRLFGG